MRSLKRTIALTATAASLLAAPVAAPATGSAAVHAAATAAQSGHGNAVALCSRMNGGERRRCMQDAEAARNAAMIRAQDVPGDAKLMDLDFPPATNGTPGGAVPAYRNLPDIPLVPDNLAVNADR